MFMFESPATDVLDVQRELAALRAELAESRRADSEEWIDRARAEHVGIWLGTFMMPWDWRATKGR